MEEQGSYDAAARPGNASGPADLVQSAAELEAMAARHRRLLEQHGGLAGRGDPHGTCACSCELRETLLECIRVLEETRRSFKSNRLAELRRSLIQKLSRHSSYS